MNDIVRAFHGCRKATDFYKVQIALENCLSPGEARDLAANRDQLAAPAREWLDGFIGAIFNERPDVRAYARLRLCDHVWFYGHAPGEARRKHLLLAFCGAAHRLMVPVTVALQHIDAAEFDVVVLTDPSRRGYLAGIDGFASDFAGILDRLSQEVGTRHYTSVRCLGTSQGGAPALLAGLHLGAERAVSVGGRPFRDHERAAAEEGSVSEAGVPRALAGKVATKIVCAFGADNAKDREAAATLAGDHIARGAWSVPVQGVATHNLLFDMLKARRLGGFLDGLLLADPPGDGESAASFRI